MAAPDKKLYRFHVANIRSIEIALNHSALAARSAISKENQPAIKSFVSLYALLLGAWAETRLRKLVYENNGLTGIERDSVMAQANQLDQWLKLIEVAFRKHYKVPSALLNDQNLPFTANARRQVLIQILEKDLRNVIEMRNKLAHGQWVYPLNNDGTDVEKGKYQQLNNENLLSLQFKKSLLTSLANLVHDLVVSLPTFERDFDRNYRQITSARTNLNSRSYARYAGQLVSKRNRGIKIRKYGRNKASSSNTEKARSFLARFLGAG